MAACLCQGKRGGLAEPLCGPGDDRDAVFEVEHRRNHTGPKVQIGFEVIEASSIRSAASDSHHWTILWASISPAFFVGQNLRVCLRRDEDTAIGETVTNYFRERQFR